LTINTIEVVRLVYLKGVLILIILTIGTLIYVFWPNGSSLPVLHTIDPFQIDTITGDNYDFNNKKIKVVAFIYTNCPDICPMTMNDFKRLQTKLKDKNLFGDDVHLITMSFDPERDDRETLKKYANVFEADFNGWKWLHGSIKETEKIISLFKLQYKQSVNGYISHSTKLYLIDKNNRIRGIYEMTKPNNPFDHEQLLFDINLLLNE
jgi:protein SCO1